MPTYEYRCRDCGHSFDIVQKMSDDQLTHCPECGGELRKVFTAPAISFKGSGFYATDHGSKGKKPSGGDTGEKKDGSADTKKSDSKKSEGSSSSDSSSSSESSSSSSTTKKEGSS
jgi:putative FmdB family regulatory protein